ncbi:MAG: NUDIX hydrolase [Phaeodactylibacter sp.]|nr:NUDIX hydrolase [Phaeodactylibacter sp.]
MIDWKKISERFAYRGWRNMIQKRFEMPDGQHADFDVVGIDTFVTIAAFTQGREAILVRQFRPGPEMVLASFPEGLVDPRESPEMTARRELLEETGFEAGHISLLKEVRSAYTTERQVILLASDCHKVGQQKLDATEFIEVFTLPLTEFRKMLRQAEDTSFVNVDAGYLALDKLGWL